MGFDAGALLFKIQAVGAQLFKQDMRESKAAIEGVEQASTKAKGSAEGLGKSQDQVAEKAKKTKAPLDEQAKSTRSVGDESVTASKKQEQQAASAEKQRQAALTLATGLVAVGLAASAMVGLSVAKFTEFDKQMSNTSAATMATAEEQKRLGDAALQSGADTAYSATEAAAAEEELAKAGQSVNDIVGGSLQGSLALAAAGQLEVARSAEIMATVLTQFQLPAKDAARVSDVLAAGAGKAQGSVDDLSLALSYVGPLAQAMGWSLEETAGTIAYFSTQGIAGEKAGTSLRGVLASLQAPSKAAADVMQQYGIQVYDSNGHMLKAAPLAEQLRTRLGSLTDQERQAALGRIFGNESLLAATLLYGGGAAAVQKWTGEVTDAGYAAEQAAKRQDNLAGDVEKLGGAFDPALIKTGSNANDTLRLLVQSTTDLVDMFGEAPAPIQTTALILGVGTAALALFSGGAVIARVKFIELKESIDFAGASMGRTALAGAAAGAVLAGLAVVIAVVAQKQAEARQRAEAYADAIGQGTDAVRKFVAQSLTAEDSWLWISRGSAADAAEKFGISLDTLADAAQGDAKALAELSDVMAAGRGDTVAATRLAEAHGLGMLEVSAAATRVTQGIEELRAAEADGTKVTEQKNKITAEGADVTKTAADAYLEAADNAGTLNDELSKLIDKIMEANGVGQDAVSANIDYQNALAKVDETIQKARDGAEGYSLTLDTNTQAGRDNMDMLVGVAQSAQDAAEKQYKLDGDTDAYRQTLESSRQALIDRATDLGMNADQARTLADQIFRIPSETEWKMLADTQQATWTIEDFKKNYGTLSGTIIYRATLPDLNGVESGAGRMGTFANGGIVSAYADGGIRFFAGGGHENHVAQMARAGAIRVWAEPETEGETYLPHAKSKRAASEMYLAQTASLFGGKYISASAMAAARSAAPAPTYAPSGGSAVTVEHIHINIDGRQVGEAVRRVDRSLNK